jgi:hypothetical protein
MARFSRNLAGFVEILDTKFDIGSVGRRKTAKLRLNQWQFPMSSNQLHLAM